MTLTIDGINYNILIDENKLGKEKIPVIFLHGFTGRGDDWEFIFDRLPENYFAVTFDQIGHGKTDSPDDLKFYTSKFKIRVLSYICEYFKFDEIVLAGYSMGGRAAYNYAINNPYNLRGLIIESSIPGIEEAVQRIDRIKSDNELANKIETEGLANFINYWYSQQMFSSLRQLPQERQGKLLEKRQDNNPLGLMNNLRGFSSGRMVSYWDKLAVISSKVLLITGELDTKFTLLNEKAQPLFINAEHKIIQNVGHNTHFEKPEEFIKIINDFLISLN